MKPGAVNISTKDIVWRIINIIVSVLWIVAAAFHFVDGTFQSVMPGLFLLIVGFASIVFELWRPRVVLENCYFMWNFMGRGILLWFSSLTLFPVSSTNVDYS
ncbi:hypothetical protein LPJ66_006193 [Kickxella alabastrina]|uniref:Uncharacterized protein n=1 Tax=Kickxella alabastrina TaxID=61397 RepID=A0ACC1IEQ9_9FUNG|nr:hypothetical protein LPJ66_006193 [Kickxella alabastrina]